MTTRKVKYIILHCSDSLYGDAKLLDQWHKQRGFERIGYHYVVLNGYRSWESYRAQQRDSEVGAIEKGRNEWEVGAHCAGYNQHSIGICLIGRGEYEIQQLMAARLLIVEDLLKRYPNAKLFGHSELNPLKKCPMMNMDKLRKEWGVTH